MAAKKREEINGSELRLSTIIEQNKIRPMEANAVMTAHGLKPSDRMEAERFLQLIEEWRRSPVRSN
ncbi:MAG: hypothetical protein FJY67_10705 [Calditrichaeota bacterium]|nr:hypothetical protein [Calditrichota bacterium]